MGRSIKKIRRERKHLLPMSNMFALVQFNDESYSICPMKNVKVQDGTTCIVKYSGGKYEAQLLASNETREHLLELKETLNPRISEENTRNQYQKPRVIKVETFTSANLLKDFKQQSLIAPGVETRPPDIVSSASYSNVESKAQGHSSLDKTIDSDITNTIIPETDESTSTVDNENKTYTLISTGAADCNLSECFISDVSQSLASNNLENLEIKTFETNEIHPVEFDNFRNDITYNTNPDDLEALPLEPSNLQDSNINSSHYSFQSLLHDAKTLFPSMEFLTSTPETLQKEEIENSTENNDNNNNNLTDNRTESATSEHPCTPDLDEHDSNNVDRNDPEYEPQEEDTSDSASDAESALDQIERRSKNGNLSHNSHNNTDGLSVSTTETLPGSNRCNDDDLHVNKSRGRNGDKKSNFCVYCHTKQQKIARHLETKHRDEPDVKKFADLPKNSSERRKIIAVIRKRGNFLFNTQTKYNDGELIVSRRPNNKFNRLANDFRPCANCKAFFSRNSLRMHFVKCTGRSSKKSRVVMVMSKQVMARMHSRATDTVKNLIFPALREDDVVRAVRYDELVIVYANKMGEKYQEARDYEMVRQRIRLLGRFLITIRKLNKDITDLTSVYDPKFCDDAVKAITIEAKLTQSSRKLATPAVASSLGTLLKLLGSILVNECIKQHDDIKKKYTKDFLKLLTQELSLSVNRRVTESQTLQKRRSKVELPSMEDIRRLCTYLEEKRNTAFRELTDNFSEQAWIDLAETTLTSLQLFNRRRAGEIERTLIEDFKNYQSLDANTDKELFNSLSKESQALAKKYVRFVIRGKLNRTVPVLLNNQLLQCIGLLLSHRKNMKISNNNPYIFGLPGEIKSKYKYLRACALLRRFAIESGTKHPERLRGTKLRKHIATVCVSLNLSEHQVTDLANYMGHADKIHRDIYRQPLVNREILGMSKLLEVAQGANEEMDDEDDDTDEEDKQLESGNNEGTDNAESFRRDDTETTIDSNVSEVLKTSNKNKLGSSAKRIRFSSPCGVRRTHWNDVEKEKVIELFGEYLRNKKLPSLKEIHCAIIENPCLQNRTSPQIKTWLHNQTRPKKNRRFSEDEL